MLLGRIIGTVWATRKDEKADGLKFQLVREIDLEGAPLGNFVVAADSVGAGEGETVLVSQGSAARQTDKTRRKPIDAVIMAIVDELDHESVQELEREYRERVEKIDEDLSELQET